MMNEYNLTIGLFDKDTCRQEIATGDAKSIIENTLLNEYGIFAFTMIECAGCYKMESNGTIVREPSIRIEIAADDDINETVKDICQDLKVKLNQESIMYKKMVSDISFE